MRTLKVVPLRSVDTYDSMEGAISAALRGPRVAEARDTSARLRGQTVVAISTEIDSTNFEFSNGLRLEISLLPNGDPAWRIENSDSDPDSLSEQAVRCIAPVRYLSGVAGNQFERTWRPQLDAEDLVGREFLSLFPSSCWLFVDFRGREIMFAGFRDIYTDDRILHWGPC